MRLQAKLDRDELTALDSDRDHALCNRLNAIVPDFVMVQCDPDVE